VWSTERARTEREEDFDTTVQVPRFVFLRAFVEKFKVRVRADELASDDQSTIRVNVATLCKLADVEQRTLMTAMDHLYRRLGEVIANGEPVAIDYGVGTLTADKGAMSFVFADNAAAEKVYAARSQADPRLLTRSARALGSRWQRTGARRHAGRQRLRIGGLEPQDGSGDVLDDSGGYDGDAPDAEARRYASGKLVEFEQAPRRGRVIRSFDARIMSSTGSAASLAPHTRAAGIGFLGGGGGGGVGSQTARVRGKNANRKNNGGGGDSVLPRVDALPHTTGAHFARSLRGASPMATIRARVPVHQHYSAAALSAPAHTPQPPSEGRQMLALADGTGGGGGGIGGVGGGGEDDGAAAAIFASPRVKAAQSMRPSSPLLDTDVGEYDSALMGAEPDARRRRSAIISPASMVPVLDGFARTQAATYTDEKYYQVGANHARFRNRQSFYSLMLLFKHSPFHFFLTFF
jgi:hypothetical protein